MSTNQVESRILKDRRSGTDRRMLEDPTCGGRERRSAKDRRNGKDRRSTIRYSITV